MTEIAGGELFCSSGYMPELTALNWLELPAIIRVLLATDGTVTKSLESYFWEPVSVQCLKQERLTSPQITTEQITTEQITTEQLAKNAEHQPPKPNLWLESDDLWCRNVCLRGEKSQKSYVQASSVVCFSILPQSLRDGLLAGGLGIGEIIRELGMETYRRVIAVGQTPAQAGKPRLVWRVYHLYYQERVLMEIKEEFNLAAFT